MKKGVPSKSTQKYFDSIENVVELPTLQLDLLEEMAIEAALVKANFNQTLAARFLNICPRVLNYKISKLKEKI